MSGASARCVASNNQYIFNFDFGEVDTNKLQRRLRRPRKSSTTSQIITPPDLPAPAQGHAQLEPWPGSPPHHPRLVKPSGLGWKRTSLAASGEGRIQGPDYLTK